LPAASVIIVAKNEEKVLPRLLARLEKQTMADFELIFIDNMSTDDTPNIVRKFMEKSSVPVKYERMEGTLGALYNRGLDLAEGDYILIIDGDEVPLENWVESHINCLSNGCDACLAPVILANLDDENNWIEEWYYRRSLLEIIHNRRYLKDRVTFNAGNTSFRAQPLKKLRFNPLLGISEDGDLGYRFLQAGYKLCFTEEPLVFHPAPDTLKKHVSYWWKLAHAQDVLLRLHPSKSIARTVYLYNLLALLDPRGIARAALGEWSRLPGFLALNALAFATLTLTHAWLAATGGSKGIGANVQRIK